MTKTQFADRLKDFIAKSDLQWPSETDSPIKYFADTIFMGMPYWLQEKGSVTIRRLGQLPNEPAWNYLLDLLSMGGAIKTYTRPGDAPSTIELIVVCLNNGHLIGFKTQIVET